MNGRAFLRPRDATFWVYAAVVGAAALWRGPWELQGAGAVAVMLWAALTFVGAAAAAVFGWALDPHAVLPRSLLVGGFGWGAACAVLAAGTDRDVRQLLVKRLGAAGGGTAVRWLAEPLVHDALAMLGALLVLALAHERALRPTDGLKIGMSCGFGIWSGELLVAMAHGGVDNPAGGLAGSLAEGLPRWFALAAAPWAAAAVAGYGFASVGHSKLRRAGTFAAAVFVSACLACAVGGVTGAALDSGTDCWPWVWSAAAGFGLAFLVLLPPRGPGWWTALGSAVVGAAALPSALAPWPYLALAACGPLLVFGFWRHATKAEGAWLAAALADEEDAVRSGCAEAADVIDVAARKSRARAALAAFGPKARPLAVRLRGGQIRLARSKALLAAEREAAGPKPDSQWRAWLARLDGEADEQRAAVRETVTDMAKEYGVYQ